MGITLSYSGLGGKVKFSGTSGKFNTAFARPQLLDLYPGATVAYSLRKLSKTYSGPAIRVRRSSDNAETNIGFISNVLDTASLLTFCGVGNGFVTTWYDQSGNSNNLRQTGAAQQPSIVVSGALVTRNSKPYIRSVGGTSFTFSTDLVTPNGTNYSFWMLYEKSATSPGDQILLKSNFQYHWLDYNTTQYINSNNNSIAISYQANVLYLANPITNYGVGAEIYRNGTLAGTTATFNGGADSSALFPAHGPTITTSEFVFYPLNQEANRVAITSNINSYYTIY